ncbi:MAG: hypothetical protein ACRDWV_07790, partial [Acidimicrobiales bacterium]
MTADTESLSNQAGRERIVPSRQRLSRPERPIPHPARPEPGLRTLTRLVGLAALVFGVSTESHPGLGGRHLLALVLLAVSASGWLGWLAARSRGNRLAAGGAILVMGVAGGAQVVLGGIALAFVGVAGMGAGLAFDLEVAVALSAAGPVSVLCAAAVDGHPLSIAIAAAGA